MVEKYSTMGSLETAIAMRDKAKKDENWDKLVQYHLEVKELEQSLKNLFTKSFTITELEKLCDAKRLGLIEFLPCSIGDVVYRISEDEIQTYRFLGIQKYSGLCNNGATLMYLEKLKDISETAKSSLIQVPIDSMGTTTFYAYRDAEIALEHQGALHD